MGTTAERPATSTSPDGGDRLASLGSFIWEDRARVLAAASRHAGDPRGNTVECMLRGASMAGAIPARSRIRIVFERGPYRVGEVVAFMNDAQVVVHRIVHQRRGRRRGAEALLITRGDAMVLPDPPIGAGAVLGRVVAMAPGAQWQPIGGRKLLPRRERLLAAVLLGASAITLRFSAHLARRLTHWLQATDRRCAWIRKLLY